MGVLSKYLVFGTGASVVQEGQGITFTSGSNKVQDLILDGPGATFVTADADLVKGTIGVSHSAQLTVKKGLNVDKFFLEDASATVTGKLVVNKHLAVSGNARLDVNDSSSTKNVFLLEEAKYVANGSLEVEEQIQVLGNAELVANGSLSAESLVLEENANVIAKGVLRVSKKITVDPNATLTANSLILREGAVVVAEGNFEVTNTATFFKNTNVKVDGSLVANELNLRDGSVVTANGDLDVKSLRLHKGARFEVGGFSAIENIYFSSIKIGGPQLVVDAPLLVEDFWNGKTKMSRENIQELIKNRTICGHGGELWTNWGHQRVGKCE